MARIAGVDLPKKEKSGICFNLYLWYRFEDLKRHFEGREYLF